mmetsp:Transcript_10756/g.44847  ORF Transcript_10756/g.44847 Transcript_10756/m.44847 type:complete len:119 (+) Transcript_10756:3091-3447(+)
MTRSKLCQLTSRVNPYELQDNDTGSAFLTMTSLTVYDALQLEEAPSLYGGYWSRTDCNRRCELFPSCYEPKTRRQLLLRPIYSVGASFSCRSSSSDIWPANGLLHHVIINGADPLQTT